jgi:D-sedoheptulose 7-phosphate isomerase
MTDHHLQHLLNRYPELAVCASDIQIAYDLLRDTYRHGGKVLVCGNGGSASDAEHIVGELMKSFMLRRRLPEMMAAKLNEVWPDDAEYLVDHLQGGLSAISLSSQTALLTAIANDVAADMVFAQQVYGYGRPGDTLIGLSTSGNSGNVVRAMQVGRVLGLSTIGLTGRRGGRLKSLCDVAICVPEDGTADIQERHLPIYHTLCIMLEEEFFAS